MQFFPDLAILELRGLLLIGELCTYLKAEDLGLDEVEGLAVDLDEALALLQTL